MSKKHKHKHKKKHHQEQVEQASTTALTLPESTQLVVTSTPKEGKQSGALLPLLVFLLGIFLGVIGTLAVLHDPSPWAMIEQVLAADETEVDALERGITVEGVGMAHSGATTTLTFIYSSSTRASATSSAFSIKVPVMIYHSVRPYKEGESEYQDLYDVTPELLDQELSYIKENGYHPILMRDVDAYWRGATSSLPEKPVILSFDDGWKNQFEYAYPLLKKHDMKAVFYIFTNPMDTNNPRWMSWENIIELDRAGMEIGGHTRTHPYLTQISHDDKKLDSEIAESKRIIEQRLGHSIVSFAYPFGLTNEAVSVAVARAGYQTARTTVSGVWNDPQHRLEFHGTLSSDKLKQFEALLHRN
jgi:peptidoglycan/xylan/chitin deacetylase (PgdA/CDA1 family)